mgnify:CR=1 FL=1
MSDEQIYGTEWHPWPEGHSHGDEPPWCGRGYFNDYREMFSRIFARVESEQKRHDSRDYRLCAVWQDEGGWWNWEHGRFSWTPDGALFDPRGHGMNPTRTRAEATCHQAAASSLRVAEQWYREFDAREEARRAEQEPDG